MTAQYWYTINCCDVNYPNFLMYSYNYGTTIWDIQWFSLIWKLVAKYFDPTHNHSVLFFTICRKIALTTRSICTNWTYLPVIIILLHLCCHRKIEENQLRLFKFFNLANRVEIFCSVCLLRAYARKKTIILIDNRLLCSAKRSVT